MVSPMSSMKSGPTGKVSGVSVSFGLLAGDMEHSRRSSSSSLLVYFPGQVFKQVAELWKLQEVGRLGALDVPICFLWVCIEKGLSALETLQRRPRSERTCHDVGVPTLGEERTLGPGPVGTSHVVCSEQPVTC